MEASMHTLKLLTLLVIAWSFPGCGEPESPADQADTQAVEAGPTEDAAAVVDVTEGDIAVVPDAVELVGTDATEVEEVEGPEVEDVSFSPGDTPEVEEVASPSEGTETAWGLITGACGDAEAAVQAGEAALLLTTYAFEDTEAFDASGLSGQTLKRYEEQNAGGSSRCSEVMSMQLLMDCEGASVLKTETEMVYDTEGKIADYLVSFGGVTAGVSVTRAYKGPTIDVYTLDDATDLLEKKLDGVKQARANVSLEDAWETSIVHIWTLHADWASTVATAWEQIDGELKADIVVLITVEVGSDYIVTDSCDD